MGIPVDPRGISGVMGSVATVPGVAVIAWPGAEIRSFPVFSLGLLNYEAVIF
ncbi:hypothetical protein ES703_108303 [subsurface metagenome]